MQDVIEAAKAKPLSYPFATAPQPARLLRIALAAFEFGLRPR